MDLLGLARWIALYAAYIWVSYVILLFSYRLTLHPLRKYPGPFVAKILDGYGGFYAVLRRVHLVTYQNHVKYGSVVRHGPNRLVFDTVTALQDIYQNPRVTKSPLYELAKMSPEHNVFDTIDVEAARRKRKIISQPITERAMRTFEPTMSEQIDVFIERLAASSRQSEPVNMTERSMWLGGDVVGHLSFGYPLRLQTEKTNRWLQSGLALASARINVYMQAPIAHKLEPVLKVLVKKVRDKYVKITAEMVRTRLSMDRDAKQDLYFFAADPMGGSENLAASELWAEAFFFIVAGGNTIAATISAMFFYLAHYPNCYKRLAEEVRSNFHSTGEIHSGEQLRRCEYLRACINETLRMTPPNTGTLWRRQLASDENEEPLVIDGHAIPRGVDLGVNLYSIHHNEKYFPDSFVFKPERWLESPPSQLELMQKAFAPFMVGTRSCPGKAVAYLEISLVFARTLWLFDFEVFRGDFGQVGAGEAGRTDGRNRTDEFQLYDTLSAMHDGPVLLFHSRNESVEGWDS